MSTPFPLPPDHRGDTVENSDAMIRAADLAFCEAMAAAITAGTENPFIGIRPIDPEASAVPLRVVVTAFGSTASAISDF